jgi:hypothetical protein
MHRVFEEKMHSVKRVWQIQLHSVAQNSAVPIKANSEDTPPKECMLTNTQLAPIPNIPMPKRTEIQKARLEG